MDSYINEMNDYNDLKNYNGYLNNGIEFTKPEYKRYSTIDNDPNSVRYIDLLD